MKRLALFFAVSLAAAPAFADDLVTRLMGKPSGGEKSYACFTRVYDAAHMAAHPQQTARSMKLLVTMEQDPEAKTPTFYFLIDLTKRDSSKSWATSGGCSVLKDEAGGEAQRLACGVDCDGGGISITLGKDDGSVRLASEGFRTWPPGTDDPDLSAYFSGGDDKLFRLERVAGAQCAGIPVDRRDRAALRKLK